tara:strand:- start:44 stop:298 length:255 start_codon:yes stop_codon:yes gene_type:complete
MNNKLERLMNYKFYAFREEIELLYLIDTVNSIEEIKLNEETFPEGAEAVYHNLKTNEVFVFFDEWERMEKEVEDNFFKILKELS